MAMQALKDSSSNGILKYFLLGLLVLAGGGLVFTDVGGFFRSGVSSTDVAKVGDDRVSFNSFDRAARRTLSQFGVTPTQAYKIGYIDQILTSEIRRRLLLKASSDAGISLGKDYVIDQMKTLLSPALSAGQSPQAALDQFLRSRGLTQSELTATVISERALSLFAGAMSAGARAPSDAMVDYIYDSANETRDIAYIPFLNKDFDDIQAPDDVQLLNAYEQMKEKYAIIETRDFDLVTINTTALDESIDISEDQILAHYEDNIDYYTIPAMREITQAIFRTETAANEAVSALTAKNFDKKAKALKADIIPNKAFEQSQLLDELKSPVYDAQSTGVIGPIKTPLGWSVVNITSIKEEHVKSLADARDDITTEIKASIFSDELFKLVDDVDEFFASGGDVTAAQEEFDLDVKPLDGINSFGTDADQKTPLLDDAGEDARSLLGAAFSLDQGESSTVQELGDGRFVFVYVRDIKPKSYQAFADVQDDVKQGWITRERAAANRAMVTALTQFNADKTLKSIASDQGKRIKGLKKIGRNDESDIIATYSIHSIFGAAQGDNFIIDLPNGMAIAQVTKIHAAKDPDEETREILQAQIAEEMQNELLTMYLDVMQDKYPTKINQALLQQQYGDSANDSAQAGY